ncbi:MAG: BrnT family toxin [Geminicoccaceae bacterium]
MQADGFDWDRGNREKCRKHGVSIEEIEALFHGSPGVYADPDHSQTEQRLRAIGRTEAGRWLFVVFTLREFDGQTLIRPVGARYMHAKEVMRYGQGQTQKTAAPALGCGGGAVRR